MRPSPRPRARTTTREPNSPSASPHEHPPIMMPSVLFLAPLFFFGVMISPDGPPRHSKAAREQKARRAAQMSSQTPLKTQVDHSVKFKLKVVLNQVVIGNISSTLILPRAPTVVDKLRDLRHAAGGRAPGLSGISQYKLQIQGHFLTCLISIITKVLY